MNIWNKWTQISLVKRILVGLVIGAILGMVIPSVKAISILGDLFVLQYVDKRLAVNVFEFFEL